MHYILVHFSRTLHEMSGCCKSFIYLYIYMYIYFIMVVKFTGKSSWMEACDQSMRGYCTWKLHYARESFSVDRIFDLASIFLSALSLLCTYADGISHCLKNVHAVRWTFRIFQSAPAHSDYHLIRCIEWVTDAFFLGDQNYCHPPSL